MSRLQRYSNIAAVVLPFVATLAAIVLLWNQAVGWTDLAILAAHVPGDRARDHDRLPPPAHPPRLSDPQAGRVRARRRRLDGGPGPGDRLGRRPPQAPRPHRRGGRPALARTSATAAASPGLWHAHVGWLFDANGQADRRKYAPDLMDDRGMRLLNRRFVSLVGALARDPVRARLAAHRHARRRAHRAALGRARADLLRPPHHLVDQLDLPLPRPPALRHRRPLDQRLVALASPRSARPGTTTTTPSRARPSTACAAGSSTRRARSSARCSGSAWPGTWCGSRPERQASAGVTPDRSTSSALAGVGRRGYERSDPAVRASRRVPAPPQRARTGHARRASTRRTMATWILTGVAGELPDQRRARLRRDRVQGAAAQPGDAVRARRRDRLLRHRRAGVRRDRAGALGDVRGPRRRSGRRARRSTPRTTRGGSRPSR